METGADRVGKPPAAEWGATAVTPPAQAEPRPWWMTACSLFCVATVLFLVPRDLLFPETRDVEVWFGFELRGVAALLTAPLHWGIFLVGAWGFWRCRPWILSAAAAYAFYVAISHLVWSELSPRGFGWTTGLVLAMAFSVPGGILLWARQRTRGRRYAS